MPFAQLFKLINKRLSSLSLETYKGKVSKSHFADLFNHYSNQVYGQNFGGIKNKYCKRLLVNICESGFDDEKSKRLITDRVISESNSRSQKFMQKHGYKNHHQENVNSLCHVHPKVFYSSREWRHLRYLAIEKYGNSCKCCGNSPKNGAVIHVDHIKPRSIFPELSLDIENLQILCEQCNLGKSNTSEKDWR